MIVFFSKNLTATLFLLVVLSSSTHACKTASIERLRSLCVENTQSSNVSPRGQKLMESGLKSGNQSEALLGLRLCVNDNVLLDTTLQRCSEEIAYEYLKMPYEEAANDGLANAAKKIVADCKKKLKEILDDIRKESSNVQELEKIEGKYHQVELFCSVEWDFEKIQIIAREFHAAGLFEQQWKGELSRFSRALAEKDERHWALLYTTIEAGLWLLEPEDEEGILQIQTARNELRKRYPRFPDEESLDAMREKLEAVGYVTSPSQLPYKLQIRQESPDVVLITDIGKHLTFIDLLREALLITNREFQEAEAKKLRNLAGKLVVEFEFGPARGYSVNAIALLVAVIIDEGMRLRDEPSNTGRQVGNQYANSAQITIRMVATNKPIACEGKAYKANTALYCPSAESANVKRILPPNGERFVFNSGTDALLSGYSYLISSELIHEVSHYLFDRAATRSVLFLAEGEAYARGEGFSQRILSGLAFSGPSRSLSETLRSVESPLPSTSLQRRFSCLVLSQPISGVELRNYLSMTADDFNAQSKEWNKEARAKAWAIYHVGLYGSNSLPNWQADLLRIGIGLWSGRDLGTKDAQKLQAIAEHTMRGLRHIRDAEEDFTCD